MLVYPHIRPDSFGPAKSALRHGNRAGAVGIWERHHGEWATTAQG